AGLAVVDKFSRHLAMIGLPQVLDAGHGLHNDGSRTGTAHRYHKPPRFRGEPAAPLAGYRRAGRSQKAARMDRYRAVRPDGDMFDDRVGDDTKHRRELDWDRKKRRDAAVELGL